MDKDNTIIKNIKKNLKTKYMKKEAILLLSIGYFASHKGVDVFHVTDDGQHFIEDNHATAHAENLKVKDVLVITRDEVAQFEKAQAKAPATDQLPEGKPLAKMNKKELLEEMVKRGIEDTEGSTNADKVAAIEAFDANAATV